jgi:hypothetical protein
MTNDPGPEVYNETSKAPGPAPPWPPAPPAHSLPNPLFVFVLFCSSCLVFFWHFTYRTYHQWQGKLLIFLPQYALLVMRWQ